MTEKASPARLGKTPARYARFRSLTIALSHGVLRITFDNPPMNTITRAMHEDLAALLPELNRDPDIRVVVFSGVGDRAFSAGGDVAEMQANIEDPERWLTGMQQAREIVNGLLRLEMPVIARVNGHAMGMGATIATLADFAYMSAAAKIGDTHVRIGLSAGDGGALIWPLLVGFGPARRYLMTGDLLTGTEAARIGLVAEAFETLSDLDAAVEAMAERLASSSAAAVRGTKMSINHLLRRLLEGEIETHLGLETLSFLSADHREGVASFLEKREPRFARPPE